VLSVEGFEGPLDWLLELTRTRRIDLARISILALVEAFQEALTLGLAVPGLSARILARWGDWLVMAADLALLRSRLLLPADSAAAREAQDAAEILRRHLLGRAEMSAAAAWLDGQKQLGRDVFARGTTDQPGEGRGGRRGGDITGLLRGCLVALQLPADAGERFRVPILPDWTMADALARITAELPGMRGRAVPLEAFLPTMPPEAPDRLRRRRLAVAATFGAALELERRGDLRLEQDGGLRPLLVQASESASQPALPLK
jgi:segregation and condensation protein A